MQHHIENTPGTSSGEQAILEAAEVLFARQGFAAASMSAIANLANTSKPNIYHHFKNKNDLYMAVMKTAVRRTSALLDALEESPGSYGQRLTEFATGQLENILEHKLSTQLVLRETLSEDSRHGEEIARLVMGEVYSRLVEMVRQGQQQSEFREDIDPTLAAFMIVAANMFFFQSAPVREHLPEIGFTSEAKSFSQETMDLLLNGIRRKGDE